MDDCTALTCEGGCGSHGNCNGKFEICNCDVAHFGTNCEIGNKESVGY